jgi:Zn-dependent protease with chaperone function
MLVQATALSGLAAMVVGDFSTVLAGVPVLLGQASYSRDAEREADREAVLILKAAGISPAVMVTLFEKIAAQRNEAARPGKAGKPGEPVEGSPSCDKLPDQESGLGIAFASHPADAERIRYFQEAAGER